MVAPYLIRGYHATTPERADQIAAGGFHRSMNRHDWLGYGIYFFQESMEFTDNWARSERWEGTIPNPAILSVDIEFDSFFDLINRRFGDVLRKTYDELDKRKRPPFAKAKKRQKPFDPYRGTPQPHPLDCYVIEVTTRLLARQGIEVKAVRGIFLDGLPLYDKAHLMTHTHIQIAVRDDAIIRNIVRVA